MSRCCVSGLSHCFLLRCRRTAAASPSCSRQYALAKRACRDRWLSILSAPREHFSSASPSPSSAAFPTVPSVASSSSPSPTDSVAAADASPAPPSALPSSSSAPGSPTVAPAAAAVKEADAAAELTELTAPSSAPPHDWELAFESGFRTALRRVKLMSLSSCVLSVISAPVMLAMSDSAVPLSGRLVVTAAVVAFGTLTTVALSQFTRPFITRIYIPPAEAESSALSSPSASPSASASASPSPSAAPPASPPSSLTFETLNFLARPRFWTLPAASLQRLDKRVLTNVRSAFDGQCKDFFLHTDLVQHERLLPIIARIADPQEQPAPAQQTQHDDDDMI